jgi:hypothetical protein
MIAREMVIAEGIGKPIDTDGEEFVAVRDAIAETMKHYAACPKWTVWAEDWLRGGDRSGATAYRAKSDAEFNHGSKHTPTPEWLAEWAAQHASLAARQLVSRYHPYSYGPVMRCDTLELVRHCHWCLRQYRISVAKRAESPKVSP